MSLCKVGFSFLVGNDGNVYEGCGWHKVGAHTYGYNRNSMAIAFVGNFEGKFIYPLVIFPYMTILLCR